MPTLQEAADSLEISSTLHVLLAPVGSEWPKIADFVFGDETTYGDFKWFGDTSADDLPEFESDGGDAESKRTADRKNMRVLYEDKTRSGTITAVAITKDFFQNTDAGGTWDDASGGWITTDDSRAREWAMLIIGVDGTHVSGVGFYKTSLLNDFTQFSLEDFKSAPVAVTVTSDDKGRVKIDFPPRLRSSAAVDTGAGA